MTEKKICCVTVGDIETNCWLYAPGDAPLSGGALPCVVIDPGDEAAAIVSALEKLNWVPAYVLLTHGHFDHVMGLPGLIEALERDFPGPLPKIGIHRLDAGYLGEGAAAAHRESFRAAGGNPAYMDAREARLPGADFFFDEGDRAGPFRVLHLPGHTPGSCGFYDEKAGVLFSGDTLFQGTWGRTDLPGGNWEDMRKSLERLRSMKKETAVFPGHGPVTSIGEEAGPDLPLFGG